MLWIEFANSYCCDPVGRESASDHLKDPTWIAEFASKWSLPVPGLRTAARRKPLCRLRDLLHQSARHLVERRDVSPADLRALNRFLSTVPVTPRITGISGSWQLKHELASHTNATECWLFAIAESFARFLVDADPSRLRLCDNPDCRWVFYDSTRSRTRRWCAVGCGDLIKVRKFRKRHRNK